MSGLYCTSCNAPAVYRSSDTARHFGVCGGRLIPIATLCSEPTVIDESDLAPGMVVVAVDELFTGPSAAAFLCSPDACLNWPDQPSLVIARTMTPCKMTDSAEEVRTIAGVRP